MTNFRRKRLDYPTNGPGTQMTILALFIMLLAFFILMNSISSVRNDAAQKVHRSLQVALGGIADSFTNGGASWITNPRQGLGSGASLQDIAGSFQSEMPGLRATYIQRSGIMRMVIAANTFNDLLGLTGKDKIDPLFEQLLKTVSNPDATQGRVYDVQLLVQYPAEILAQDDRSNLTTQQYLTMWAQALEKHGMSPKRLSIGVGDGHAGFVTMIIFPHEETEKLSASPSAGNVDITNPTATKTGAP